MNRPKQKNIILQDLLKIINLNLYDMQAEDIIVYIVKNIQQQKYIFL